jgi:pyruvate dehydrogenase E2 component (dihydrolipoamide acetyltransferase)
MTQEAGEGASKEQRIYASTLARKLAEKKSIPLEKVKGTGTRGRVVMDDVIKTLEEKTPPVEDKKIPVRGKGLFGQTLPMTQMRKVIARKMAQSAFTAPHIYFVTEVDMNELLLFKDKVQGDFEKEFQVRISINDFVIKATALTIRDFPLLNAMMKGEEIYVMPEINIGLAVAMEEGLIVPAIPHADELGLDEIAKIRANLVERARGGKLKMEEIERGTFTISSLAQYDITFFTAILNPPQSGILSIGKTREFKEETGMKKIASFGLSVDHRVINGAVAATFLQSLKKRLENPSFTFMQLRR